MIAGLEKIKIGIAPIGWTNDDMPDLGKENSFEKTIAEMAQAGFSGCEIGSRFPGEKEKIKSALDLLGISVCNAWMSTYLLTKPMGNTLTDFRKHLEKLQYLGAKVVGISEQSNSVQGCLDVPILGRKVEFTPEQWDIVCSGFDILGDIASDYGISLIVHHHMGTGVQTVREIDYLMERTDPKHVGLLLDTGHLAFCGEDYLEVYTKHKKRIKHIHLKDIRFDVLEKVRSADMSFLDGVREGVFTVPGDGGIDFILLFEFLRHDCYDGWLVVEAEQDPAKANPLEYALMARKFIRESLGI